MTGELPQGIVDDIVEYLECSEGEARALPLREQLDAYLHWNGLIGWTRNVMEIVNHHRPAPEGE